MTGDGGESGRITSHVLVPVANEEDARATARALEPFDVGRMTVTYVVEKGGGVPDKTPVEQSEAEGRAAFDAFRETHPDAEDRLAYGRDVVDEIRAVAADVGASAVAFRPRGGSRVIQFLSGDRALRLVTEADRPVIAVPVASEDA